MVSAEDAVPRVYQSVGRWRLGDRDAVELMVRQAAREITEAINLAATESTAAVRRAESISEDILNTRKSAQDIVEGYARRAPGRSIEAMKAQVRRARSQSRHFKFNTQDQSETFLRLLAAADSVLALAEQELARAPEPPRPTLPEPIPAQKPAPARFVLVDNVLRLDHAPAATGPEAERLADAARDALLGECDLLADSLRAAGNVDSRVASAVERLRKLIEARENIVALGMANNSSRHLFQAVGEQSDAIAGMLRGFSRNIDLYVGQFPDWQQFLENAAIADLAGVNADEARERAARLAEKLEAAAEHVHPEVPAAIRELVAQVSGSDGRDRKGLFGLLQGVGNLIYVAAGYALRGVGDLILDQAKDQASQFLVGIIVQAGAVIAPAAIMLADGIWISQAVEAATYLYHRAALTGGIDGEAAGADTPKLVDDLVLARFDQRHLEDLANQLSHEGVRWSRADSQLDESDGVVIHFRDDATEADRVLALAIANRVAAQFDRDPGAA